MDNGNMEAGFGSFTDTGQWKLLLFLSSTGMTALLKNIANPEVKPIKLLRNEWLPNDDRLLQHIEGTIYDNPRLLDDFSTQIIISTSKTLWIPAESDEDDEIDENLFTAIYPADFDDIFTDFNDDTVALYTLTQGLGSFLNRTLPGCRITSELNILKNNYQRHNTKGDSIFAVVGEGKADILAFNKGKLICGATYKWKEPADIAYRIMLITDAYKLDREKIELHLIGQKGSIANLRKMMSQFIPNVKAGRLPHLTVTENLPVAMAIVAEKP